MYLSDISRRGQSHGISTIAQNNELVIHPWASCNHREVLRLASHTLLGHKNSDTPCRKYWLPQLSILYCLLFKLSGLLWLFFVFLLFLFVISALLFLFWTPSAKSWLSRMQGSVVLIFAFSWCYVFFPLCKLCLVVFHPFVVAFVVCPIFCSISWCLKKKLLSLLSLPMPHTFNSLQLIWSNLWFCQSTLVKVERI